MKKYKKTILIIVTIIISFVILLLLFISPIAKYVIQKYDYQLSGREITLDWIYINPFTGYVHINDLKIYEQNANPNKSTAKDVFFSAHGLTANMAMVKLLSKTYEITEVELDKPIGTVIQDKKHFNFSDLIEKFSSKEKSSVKKEPAHFSILNVKILDGVFYYQELQTPINYFIKNFNFESDGMRWNTDTIESKFSFLSGIGTGKINGSFNLNLKSKNYQLDANVNKFDLQIIGQYLKKLTNYGTFKAFLDANIKAQGNFDSQEDITATGYVAINDFRFGKNEKEDYLSFDKLALAIKKISPKKHVYLLDSVILAKPYFKYERYDKLDNLQNIFGKKGANVKSAASKDAEFNLIIEIANYVKILAKNFFRSNYKISRVGIYNGNIEYNDFAINEKFSMALNPLFITADSIDNNRKRVSVNLKSGLAPYGKMAIDISINPKDSSDFEINYDLHNIPMPLFNPYLITYTSFPLDRGSIALKGKWNVNNGLIKSNNHLIIIDPRVGDRMKNKANNWLPIRLIMAFVRERGNVIDYEIPITGDLSNPKFKFKDIILDVLTNIVVKPITTPYRIEVKNVENEIEKSFSLKWPVNSAELSNTQENFVEDIAEFLEETKEASITITPMQYTAKEKEYILFYEAKKQYYITTNKISNQAFCEADSQKIAKMSIKDSLFVKYLNNQTKNNLLFTVQDKCAALIDSTIINKKLNLLNNNRKNTLMEFFIEKNVEAKVKIGAVENTIPYNGFSFYKIKYKNDFPAYVIKAYRKMSELNDEEPRKKFKKFRKKKYTNTIDIK
jgi:hypothetical protein